jgi:superfamily II DNA/RNA helicase
MIIGKVIPRRDVPSSEKSLLETTSEALTQKSNWDGTSLSKPLQQLLIRHGYSKPSEIQFKTLEYLLPRYSSMPTPSLEAAQPKSFSKTMHSLPGDAILMSETGSGKTLAYLLPILQRIYSGDALLESKIQSPFAVILLPTAELVVQVKKMLTNLFQLPKASNQDPELHEELRILASFKSQLPIISLTKTERHGFIKYLKALNIKNYIKNKASKSKLLYNEAERDSEGETSHIIAAEETESVEIVKMTGNDVTTYAKPMYPSIFLTTPGVLFDNYDFKDIQLLFESSKFVVIDEADLTLQTDIDLAATNYLLRILNLRFENYQKNALDTKWACSFKKSASCT